ncbi:12502_t:CDS:1, partial [Ambispora leptoticha]
STAFMTLGAAGSIAATGVATSVALRTIWLEECEKNLRHVQVIDKEIGNIINVVQGFGMWWNVMLQNVQASKEITENKIKAQMDRKKIKLNKIIAGNMKKDWVELESRFENYCTEINNLII